MKKLIIFGSGGFARETSWLVETINVCKKEWDILVLYRHDKQ